MKGSVMSAVHHLRTAIEYMDDFVRESNKKGAGSRGAAMFGEYSRKMRWIITDMMTYPHFCQEVRDGFRNELQSDVFAYQSIIQKCALLEPMQREMLDDVLDRILAGETIEIQLKEPA